MTAVLLVSIAGFVATETSRVLKAANDFEVLGRLVATDSSCLVLTCAVCSVEGGQDGRLVATDSSCSVLTCAVCNVEGGSRKTKWLCARVDTKHVN